MSAARSTTASPARRSRRCLLHTTVYCGVPAALESFRIAAEVLKEEDAKKR